MSLPKNEIKQINRIGSLESDPVYEIIGKGGITYVMVEKSGKPLMLSAGAHPGIAKYAAKKKAKNLVLYDLQKHDDSVFEPFANDHDAFVNFFNSKNS